MSHKRLSQYSVIAGGKLSKVIEFSKGEAEIYVRNFIETHLSHAVLKAFGGLKDIKAYFSDTKQLKEQVEGQIKTVTDAINDTVTAIRQEIDGYTDSLGNIIPPLTGDAKEKAEEKIKSLEKAAEDIGLAKNNISEVEDDADFNKENIDQAKNKVFDSLEDLIEKGITSLISKKSSSGDEGSTTTTLNLNAEKNKIGTNLNKLRKWQFDKFEEEFSAELYIGTYHEYKYAKTKEELCELINTAVKSLGADLKLKPEEYKLSDTELIRTDNGKNIEEAIGDILTEKHIEFKRINIDWHDKNFDMADDPFEY